MDNTTTVDSDFDAIKGAILASRELAQVDTQDDVESVDFSGLGYTVSDSDESITFNTLGMDFVFRPDGELSIVELDEGELRFFAVEESELKDNIREFLTWRAKVIESSGI